MAVDPSPSYEELVAENAQLEVMVEVLRGEIAELRRQLGQNSRNSSKPPSSDSPFVKPAPKSLRGRSGRRPGGQQGHPGSEHRSVYIEQRPEHAGHAMHTILVDDLDALVAQIADRGLEPAKRETYSNGVRKVTYHDPDGNEIGYGGVPL